ALYRTHVVWQFRLGSILWRVVPCRIRNRSTGIADANRVGVRAWRGRERECAEAMSTKGTLEAAWKARYPDIGVLCGHRGPGDTFSLSTAPTNGWRSIVSPRDERNSSKVPACPRCRQLMERQRQLRSWGVLAAILAALGLYVTLVVCYQGPLVNVVRS